MTTVLVSGGFDPLHPGHLDYLEGAREYGQVIVALNSDEWLIRKKGYRLLPWSERARLLNALEIVASVTRVLDDDGTVCEAIRAVLPDYMANGGDRVSPHPKEHEVCRDLGVTELFRIGGAKTYSSSDLIRAAMLKLREREERSQI